MNKIVNRIGLSCLMLGALAVAGTKAADSNSGGGNDTPPPPPGGNSGSQDGGGQHHPHRPPPSADMFFKRFDLNKDGVVTYDEFVKGHETPPPPPPSENGNNGKSNPPPPPALTQEQLKERFSSLDANGDGKITREEYEAALKRGPPHGQGQGDGQGQGQGKGRPKGGGQ